MDLILNGGVSSFQLAKPHDLRGSVRMARIRLTGQRLRQAANPINTQIRDFLGKRRHIRL
ncbi:hypothetical protein CIP107578_00133 [Corynebacterium diphtheriae]|nr:hypothetical protein CIP107558_00133 [Corynebacterium diphtheriae]CAB0627303.1 hypothetical protein CIP107578_00133 [Corynebacterium diphtheriae]